MAFNPEQMQLPMDSSMIQRAMNGLAVVSDDMDYVLADDLFRMLKVVKKKELTNPLESFKKDKIISFFTLLCTRVHVYD